MLSLVLYSSGHRRSNLGWRDVSWVGSLKGVEKESGVKDALMAPTPQREREDPGLCRGRRQTCEVGPTKPGLSFMELRRGCCLRDMALMPSPHSVSG